jgi:hypothetical protein
LSGSSDRQVGVVSGHSVLLKPFAFVDGHQMRGFSTGCEGCNATGNVASRIVEDRLLWDPMKVQLRKEERRLQLGDRDLVDNRVWIRSMICA